MNRPVRVVRATCLAAMVFVTLLAIPPLEAAGDLTGIRVCLDPGHGGADPGAVNEEFGLYESEINLDVSLALRDLLQNSGAEVVMTREDDRYLENRDRYTFCNEQQATLLVSVHTNSVVDPEVDGAMALYFKSEDKVLAQAMYNLMLPAMRDSAPDPSSFIDWGVLRYASGVLMKSDMPAAMMEPLLMSNPAEAALLVQPIDEGCANYACRRGEIAVALHEGVLAYVMGAGPGGALHVASIDMSYTHKGPNFYVTTVVGVQDEDGHPVSGALVSIETGVDGVPVAASTATTGDDGQASFRLKWGAPGTFVSTVTDVTKDGWTYDVSANAETSETLEVH